MLTYTIARNLLGTLSGDSGPGNLTTLDRLHNEAVREVIALKPWGFRQKTWTRSTETDNVHQLPADCAKVVNITVTPDGTTKYTPRVVRDRATWDRLTQSTNVTSNIPEAVFVFERTYSFYPKPSSAVSNSVTIVGERLVKDLSIADYTTGTISTATNASTAIVGSGTSWTAQMAGRYIRISDSNTANTGDGKWYEVASVESATALTLVAPYEGTSISAGTAAYTLGQTSIIPEAHQMVPIYRVLQNYFTYIQPEKDRADRARQDFNERYKVMQAECGSMTVL